MGERNKPSFYSCNSSREELVSLGKIRNDRVVKKNGLESELSFETKDRSSIRVTHNIDTYDGYVSSSRSDINSKPEDYKDPVVRMLIKYHLDKLRKDPTLESIKTSFKINEKSLKYLQRLSRCKLD